MPTGWERIRDECFLSTNGDSFVRCVEKVDEWNKIKQPECFGRLKEFVKCADFCEFTSLKYFPSSDGGNGWINYVHPSNTRCNTQNFVDCLSHLRGFQSCSGSSAWGTIRNECILSTNMNKFKQCLETVNDSVKCEQKACNDHLSEFIKCSDVCELRVEQYSPATESLQCIGSQTRCSKQARTECLQHFWNFKRCSASGNCPMQQT